MIVNFPSLTIRPNILKRGISVPGHEHTFDHLSLLAIGECRVDVTTDKGDRGYRNITAPTDAQLLAITDALDHTRSVDNVQALIEQFCFNVPANWTHKITGVAAVSMFLCCYAPRDEEGNAVNIHPENTRDYYEWISE